MNVKSGLVVLILLAILVFPVGAAVMTTNISANQYFARTWNDTLSGHRNAANDHVTVVNPAPTALYALITANSSSPYIADYRYAVITIPTGSMGTGATVTAGTITAYAGLRLSDLGQMNLTWMSISPTNAGGTLLDTDYNKTGFTQVTDEIPYSALATANGTLTWHLNAQGLSRVNVTGNTTFALVSNWTLQNPPNTPSWVSGGISRASIRSIGYAGGVFTPSASFTYTPGTSPPVTSDLKVYPIPIVNSSKKILPNVNTNLPAEGYTASLSAAPTEYEPASFVIKSGQSLSNIALSATSLPDADGTGHTAIPLSAVDLKWVKVWYVSGANTDPNLWLGTVRYELQPELLLNYDSLVRVNYTQQTNELWVYNTTYPGGAYIHVDNRTIGGFPANAYIWDNETPAGFPQNMTALPALENKQVWATVHVPAGQAVGNYTGKVWINTTEATPVAVNLSVQVLPVTLNTSSMPFGWYFSYKPSTSPSYGSWFVANGGYVPFDVYNASLINLKDHGILYPTEYNQGGWGTDGYARAERDLAIRNELGFPTDKIFFWASPLYTYIYNGLTTPPYQNLLATNLTQLRNLTTTYGFTDAYYYGHDEPSAAQMVADYPILRTTVTNNSKTFYATNWDGRAAPYANVSSAVVVNQQGTASVYNTTLLNLFRASSPNTTVLIYDWPQGGLENFDLYRKHYGFQIYTSGYDGVMDFGYSHVMGQSVWNDYDSLGSHIRDHAMVYPKSDGVIDTIQWEGMREAIDDVRYAEALVAQEGNATTALSLINIGLSEGADMSVIRSRISAHILGTPATASFGKSKAVIRLPALVQFNDTSIAATSWNWSFGDGGYSSVQNPSHKYTRSGIFTVNLTINGISSALSKVIVTRGGWFMLVRHLIVAIGAGSIQTLYSEANTP